MPETHPQLVATVLDSTDARGLAEFYRELLGYEYRHDDHPPPPGRPDPRGQEWLVLYEVDGGPRLAFQSVDELPPPTWPEPTRPQQLHLDLTVGTAAELAIQRDRAVGLGATVLDDRSDDDTEELIVFADPAGHPFCIINNKKG